MSQPINRAGTTTNATKIHLGLGFGQEVKSKARPFKARPFSSFMFKFGLTTFCSLLVGDLSRLDDATAPPRIGR